MLNLIKNQTFFTTVAAIRVFCALTLFSLVIDFFFGGGNSFAVILKSVESLCIPT